MGYQVGEKLPQRMSPKDMQKAFDLSESRFYRLVKAGRFDWCLMRPEVGSPAWSGLLVQRYFEGESMTGRALRRAG